MQNQRGRTGAWLRLDARWSVFMFGCGTRCGRRAALFPRRPAPSAAAAPPLWSGSRFPDFLPAELHSALAEVKETRRNHLLLRRRGSGFLPLSFTRNLQRCILQRPERQEATWRLIFARFGAHVRPPGGFRSGGCPRSSRRREDDALGRPWLLSPAAGLLLPAADGRLRPRDPGGGCPEERRPGPERDPRWAPSSKPSVEEESGPRPGWDVAPGRWPPPPVDRPQAPRLEAPRLEAPREDGLRQIQEERGRGHRGRGPGREGPFGGPGGGPGPRGPPGRPRAAGLRPEALGGDRGARRAAVGGAGPSLWRHPLHRVRRALRTSEVSGSSWTHFGGIRLLFRWVGKFWERLGPFERQLVQTGTRPQMFWDLPRIPAVLPGSEAISGSACLFLSGWNSNLCVLQFCVVLLCVCCAGCHRNGAVRRKRSEV